MYDLIADILKYKMGRGDVTFKEHYEFTKI